MRDLNHSRPLDVHRWSDYPEVDEWVDKFWHQHLAEYFPGCRWRWQEAEANASEHVQGAVPRSLHPVARRPRRCASASLAPGHEYSANSRYNALHISYKLVEVIDALLEQGFIDQHRGTEGARKVTRIWPA